MRSTSAADLFRDIRRHFADEPILACEEAGGVILTTRGFRHHSGEVRLSGAVNLSNFGAGEITFSCAFVLDLDPFGPDDDDESSDDRRLRRTN